MYAILQLGSLVPVFVRYDVPHQNRSLYDCLMRGDELLSQYLSKTRKRIPGESSDKRSC